jgi:hypothetical protein
MNQKQSAREAKLLLFKPFNVVAPWWRGVPHAPCFAKGFLAFYIFNLQIGQQSGVRKTVVKKATGGAQQPWVSRSPIEGDFYFAGNERQGRDFSLCFLS